MRKSQYIPPLLMYHEVEIKELAAINRIQAGQGLPAHFDILLDMTDLLLVGANNKKVRDVEELCFLGRDVLDTVAKRHARTGKVGTTGEELKLLIAIHGVAADFWKRQSGEYYAAAVRSLAAYRKQQRQTRKTK